jgi:hypothetical protein
MPESRTARSALPPVGALEVDLPADVLRRELARQGIDLDRPSGRLLLELLAHDEAAEPRPLAARKRNRRRRA